MAGSRLIRRLLPAVTCVIAVACSDSTGPAPDRAAEFRANADPVRGLAAFRSDCATCHASGDGYDLALFGFPESDIVRRGVDHVDSATAFDIAAHVETFDVTSLGRAARPFQPTGALATSDLDMWATLFGTADWPAALTPEQLAAIDPLDVAIPLGLPTWSSEADETDWIPERPLPDRVLSAEGGAVRSALEAYFAAPDLDRLTTVLDHFRAVTADLENTTDKLCRGEASTHPEFEACFEARRWMSSLAAIHLLRHGVPDDVPETIFRTWWETGEAAVTVRFQIGPADESRITAVAQWLYLGFLFGPDHFQERNGYLGQHLEQRYPRLAVFSYLRRMVGSGPAQTDPFQRYVDASSAVVRAPDAIAMDIAGFVLDYLLTAEVPSDAEFRGFSALLVRNIYDDLIAFKGMDPASERAEELRAQRDLVLARLED